MYPMSEMSWEHAAEARAALSEIVNDPQHGVAALSSGPTMSNLLKDLLPDAPREKSILVAAAEAGLADTLREHVAQGMDPSTAIRLAASSFASSTPFTADACSWVAGELAVALGISQAAPGGVPEAPAAGFDPAQGMPTQIAPIPGYQPGQQPTAAADQGGQAAGPTVPGGGGGWQQPADQGWQQPAQQPGWQQPAQQGGWQQPAQQGGWQQPVQQPGWQQPGQQPGWQPGGWQPGGPVKTGGSKRGWFIGGGAVAALVVVGVVLASLAGGGKPKPTLSPHTTTPPVTSPATSPAVTNPAQPTGTDPLSTIFHPSGHAPPGTNCTSTANTNDQNLNAATLVAATFCDHTFSPYGSAVHVWAYQFDSMADFQTGINRLNRWTGYDTPGRLGTTCPPGTNSRGRTEWWALTNPKYTTHRNDQFLECFTDHLKSVGARAFLIWTLPTQYVIFVGENTLGDSPASFSYLVKWWKHVAYG
jgi:hypothetical protein